jgi:hypothetical protein
MNMHQLAIIKKTFSSVTHAKRLNTLQQMVASAFQASSLTVTQLGRSLPGTLSERNGIRKADRFLSNTKLHDDYPSLCQKLAAALIAPSSSPWILVDWTKMPHGDYHALRAAVVASGRAITLYEEVHDEKSLGKAKVHNQFLQALQAVLPVSCHPIVITDAGFGVPWFKAVLKLGWHYVGRVRGHKYYAQQIDSWQKIADLAAVATATPKHLGEISFTKSHAFMTQLYVVKHLSKGRHAFNSSGHIRKDSNSKRQSKAAREPLCIVTSLKPTSHSPGKVIQIYQTRMQIEEGLRDLKSTKYGFGFEHMMSYKPKRIQVLLLIAQIAAFIAYVVGHIAENQHKHYQFQANSIKHRRVLSLFYLGRRIIKKYLYQPPQTNQMLKNHHPSLAMELL